MHPVSESSRHRDNRPANWARTYKRLERNIAELRALECEVITPPRFDVHPELRSVVDMGHQNEDDS